MRPVSALLGDRLAPGRPDRRRADLASVDLGERRLGRRCWSRRASAARSAPGSSRVLSTRRRPGSGAASMPVPTTASVTSSTLSARVGEIWPGTRRRPRTRCRSSARGRPAPTTAISDDRREMQVPALATADEVEGDLAPVERGADLSELGHQASPRRGLARQSSCSGGMPRCSRSRPGPLVALAEELGPRQQRHHRLGEEEHDEDVDERVRPSVNAKPLTTPIAKMNSTSAARNETRVGRQDRASARGPSRSRPTCAGSGRRAPRPAVVRSRR